MAPKSATVKSTKSYSASSTETRKNARITMERMEATNNRLKLTRARLDGQLGCAKGIFEIFIVHMLVKKAAGRSREWSGTSGEGATIH